MHENYRFIDSTGRVEAGKKRGLKNWKTFFELFPDYQNIFTKLIEKKDEVIIVGHFKCDDDFLDGPAIGIARLKYNKITEWGVFKDTETNRAKLNIPLKI